MADKSIAALLFRQLFSRCRCDCRKTSLPSTQRHVRSYQVQSERRRMLPDGVTAGSQPHPTRLPPSDPHHVQRRLESVYTRNRGRKQKEEKQLAWRQRNDVLPADRRAEFNAYDPTTSAQLALKQRRPKHTKMLMRDFIEDSLYNPHYGYFPKQAVIFDPGSDPFDFNSMNSETDFYNQLGHRYTAFEDKLDETQPKDTRQLWHTPTELFKPHYAEAIARYMVSNYKLTSYPYHDLIIYELGAGNGTFMLNVLDYIAHTDPDVYARTQYRIIEISASLASLQASALSRSAYSQTHASKVSIVNTSIFDWDAYIPNPCFVLALEVIDNFAHDVIRWDPKTETPLQGHVLIDAQGDFYQFYTPELDPVASRYLRVRDAACSDNDLPLTHPLRWSRWKRNLRRYLPFAPNLSEPEWIPTRAMQFFDILQRYFPAHNLVLADFDGLEQGIEGGGNMGVNAPVVQTRYKRRTVPVGTPLVHQGYFDILHPTDFNSTSLIYQALTGRFSRTASHAEFMAKWADTERTECRNGENPLLGWYRNQRVLWTV